MEYKGCNLLCEESIPFPCLCKSQQTVEENANPIHGHVCFVSITIDTVDFS